MEIFLAFVTGINFVLFVLCVGMIAATRKEINESLKKSTDNMLATIAKLFSVLDQDVILPLEKKVIELEEKVNSAKPYVN